MSKRRGILAIVPAIALLPVCPTQGFAQDTKSVVSYSGFEAVDSALFYYSGAILAFNQDISRPGFLINGFVGIGDYDYSTTGVPGGKVDGDATWLRGMLGYQTFAWDMRLAAYAGVDWQNNELHPKDTSNPVAGGETGFIIDAEMETLKPSDIYFGLIGQYSTANEWYWSRLRTGYGFGRVIIGPEGILFGNVGFDAQRAGAFLDVPVKLGRDLVFDVTFSGGYQWIGGIGSGGQDGANVGGDSDSGYGNISFYTVF